MLGFFKRKPSAPPSQPPESKPAPAPLDDAELALRLQEADDAMRGQDFDLCRSLLNEMAQSNPRDSGVRTRVGILHFRVADYALARQVLEPLAIEEPQNGEALLFLASSFFHLGQFQAALGAATAARKLRPTDPDPAMLVGDVYAEFGYMEEAAVHYRQASDLAPVSEAPLYRLALISEKSETRLEEYEGFGTDIAARRRTVVSRLQAQERLEGLDLERTAALLALLSGAKETFPEAVQMALKLSVEDDLPFEIERHILRVLAAQGDCNRTLAVAERSFERNPDSIELKRLLGRTWICAASELWMSGWRISSEAVTISRHYHHKHGVPVWEGQKLGSGKLLVYQDLGAGDAILAFRLLPILARRGIDYRLWVQPALADLAEQIPDCQLIRANTEFVPGKDVHGCDFAISLFGLIAALYLGPDELADPPVIRALPEHAPELRSRIRALPGIRIGLLHGGNPLRRDDWLRSIPEDALKKLEGLGPVSWVNLMVDSRPDKARVCESLSMIDPMAEVRSFCDTAAVVEELDAVVAVDASVAHVAGNLRKPLWVLAPSLIDWRWQIGDRSSPWWPTAKVLRSPAPGDWNSCIDTLREELARFVRDRGQDAKAPLPEQPVGALKAPA